MDFSRYDTHPQYASFVGEVSNYLDEVLTEQLVAETKRRQDEHDPDFFSALGRRGWVVPDWAPADGGAGLDYRQIEILDTEVAKREGPVLNVSTTRMTLPTVAKYARDPIRERVIRDVVAGNSAVLLGYTEPDGGSDIATVKTRATRRDDGSWLIQGGKAFTSGAHHAKYVFLIANTNPSGPKRKNLTIFLLPLATPGVDVAPIYTLGERSNMLHLSDVVLGDEYRVGEIDDGWTVLSDPLAAEHGTNGTSERPNGYLPRAYARNLALALDTTMEWIDSPDSPLSKEDPLVLRTIGEVSRLIASSTATFGMTGRIAAAEAEVQGAALLMDLIGADSIVDEDAPTSVAQRVFRKGQVSLTYGGTVEVIKNVLGRALGLPPQRYGN